MVIKLEPAKETDLDFIMNMENREEYASYITRWGRNTHLANLRDRDKRYLVVRKGGQSLGYVILEGLLSPHSSICLIKIVVDAPGQGLGPIILEQIKTMAFEELGAVRLWLDVVPENPRAKKAYLKAGFVEEGTLRQAMIINGKRVSLTILSILAEEYEASK